MSVLFEILVLGGGWAALEWLASAPERRQLRELRRRNADRSTGRPTLRFPILFPSAQAAHAASAAVRSLGFEYAVDGHPSPVIQRWADARARLPLSIWAVRRAKRRLQHAVDRYDGLVFFPLDVAMGEPPDRAA